MMIHYGISDQLDTLKHHYFGLPDLLTQAVAQEMQRIPRAFTGLLGPATAWSITYLPQVGFMVRVQGGPLPESVSEFLPDYEFGFEGPAGEGEEGEESWYYKCEVTEELNQQYGDILHRIKDLEVSILTSNLLW